ncbi:BLUF domain-containing protein [Sphingosinithalassobacter tenebrarum]|uniref:BLUF domain-containing protein n=1 Tax=Stakelama tenebrarum TaxID=2711215 RepID=A0A6G6YAV5_9SPHN|nr:BLUF domain-containing protein [Sphingosinithalassobacter tenebrarum]
MLQIVYVSSLAPGARIDAAAMLATARRNNGRDGITGMLFADGKRFLQAMEGPPEKVETTLSRIRRDPRHRAIVVLSKRNIAQREFGAWDMAHYDRADEGDFGTRVRELTSAASPAVRATIEGFVALRTERPD